jgi:hypothetical protein
LSYLTIAEAGDFGQLWPDYLTEEEYTALKTCLAQNPEDGDLIQGSGGLRKLRWSIAGRGKSGGVRLTQL